MNRRPAATAFAAVVLLAAFVVFAFWREAPGFSTSAATLPAAKTGAASAVTDTSATLNGTVNARSTTTTTYFEWGPSQAYGAKTADTVTTARSTVAQKATLTGLTAGTTYHFRIVATNAKGTSYGADAMFRTTGAPTSTSTSSTSATPTDTSPTSTDTSAGTVCANPYFTTSDPNGGIADAGYYVHNNLWNAARYPGTKGTTEVCSYHSWNHIGTATNTGDGAVKTYPNVHKDYSRRTIASFPRLTSRFAATSPGTGIYNVAYDLWLNGVPNDEVMIWTDNRNQVPAGSRFASGVELSGYTWDVYATSGNGYLAFVPSNGARITSGTVDLKAILGYLVSKGRVASNATVDQVCYGVEIVDTGGSPATWRFTDFSITDS